MDNILKPNETQLTVVVLTRTISPELLQMHLNMLSSFKENSPVGAQLIALENNSEPGLREQWQRAVEDAGYRYEFVEGPFNMNKLYNFGTKLTKSEFICYCNSDIIFFPHWADNIVKHFRKDPDLVCVTPYTGLTAAEDTDDKPAFYRKGKEPEDKLVYTNILAAWCYCFKRDFVIDVMHGWDESFSSYYQDDDVKRFLAQGGYKTAVALDSRVDHLAGRTFKSLPRDFFHQEWQKNEKQFMEKWGETKT